MREEIKNLFRYLVRERRGQFFGALFGVLFGICVLLFGFWRTFFVLFCGTVGLFVGGRIESGAWLEDLRDHLPDKIQYWHHFD